MSRVQRVRSLTGRAARAALRVTLPWVHALPASRWVHGRIKAAMPETWERVRLRVFPPPPPPPQPPAFELPPPVSPASPPQPHQGPPAWEAAQAQFAAALLATAGYAPTSSADDTNDALPTPADTA